MSTKPHTTCRTFPTSISVCVQVVILAKSISGEQSYKDDLRQMAFETCFVHHIRGYEGNGAKHHNATNCATFSDDNLSVAKLKQISKACPHCGSCVRKMDGCDNMTCKSGPSCLAFHLICVLVANPAL